jgi:hypothetical protein
MNLHTVRETDEAFFYQHLLMIMVEDADFAFFQIFFSELKYTRTEAFAAYTMLALMCDVGGTLGLFIGGTVLTMFEVADLILSLIATWANKRKQRKPVKPRQVVPVTSEIAVQDIL